MRKKTKQTLIPFLAVAIAFAGLFIFSFWNRASTDGRSKATSDDQLFTIEQNATWRTFIHPTLGYSFPYPPEASVIMGGTNSTTQPHAIVGLTLPDDYLTFEIVPLATDQKITYPGEFDTLVADMWNLNDAKRQKDEEYEGAYLSPLVSSTVDGEEAYVFTAGRALLVSEKLVEELPRKETFVLTSYDGQVYLFRFSPEYPYAEAIVGSFTFATTTPNALKPDVGRS